MGTLSKNVSSFGFLWLRYHCLGVTTFGSQMAFSLRSLKLYVLLVIPRIRQYQWSLHFLWYDSDRRPAASLSHWVTSDRGQGACEIPRELRSIESVVTFPPRPQCPPLLTTAKSIRVTSTLCLSSCMRPKGSCRRPRPVEGMSHRSRRTSRF